MISRDTYRLVRVAGLRDDEWALSPGQTYRLGRTSGETHPEIDLAPDPLVSREHARIWFDEGWKVEDLGSRHGTRLRGAPFPSREPWPLDPGDDLQVGESRLVLVPPGVSCLQSGPLLLEITLRDSTAYAQITSRRSPLEQLRIRNVSASPAALESLSVSIDGLAREEFAPRSLAPGECVELAPPRLENAAPALQSQVERVRRRVDVEMNATSLEESDLGLWCLAGNEWSYRPDWWPALASFVLPNHSAVTRLAAEASARAGDGDQGILRALYDHFADDWRIEYRLEAPHFATDSQKIRLPDQILWDEAAHRGGGTCLDLALFMAAALESAGLQPLVAIVDLGDTRHALVGCWNAPGPRLEPVLTTPERLVRLATWVDPNGCTRDPAHRKEFDASMDDARDLLESRPLMFALDVVAARQDGFLPMPLGGEPQLGADVVDVIAAAHGAAQAAGAPVGTVPLLIGLLRRVGGVTRDLLGHTHAEADDKVRQLTGGLRPAQGDTRATRGYFEVLAAAHVRASSSGLGVVNEANLLAALVSVESKALDAALQWLGVDRGEVRKRLTELPGAGQDEPSMFEAPTGGQRRQKACTP